MKAFHFKRLEKLAAFLDTLPRQKFNFAVIAREEGRPMLQALRAGKTACGTVACAVGWCPAVFPRNAKWERWGGTSHSVTFDGDDRSVSLEGAGNFFGISFADSIGLFEPESSGLGHLATPKQVARHIRKFVRAKQKEMAAR